MELNTREHESQGISFITVPSLWEGGTCSHHKPGHGRCEGGAALLPSWRYKPARTSFQNMICCSHTHTTGTKIHLPTVWNIPPHPPCPMLGTISRTVPPPVLGTISRGQLAGWCPHKCWVHLAGRCPHHHVRTHSSSDIHIPGKATQQVAGFKACLRVSG